MSNYAIEIKDLVKQFDNFKLGPINLTIPKGTIVGYIGQNGAGKSTTIKLLLGLLNKDSGEIKILDEINPSSVGLKDKLGIVFDDLLVPEEMTLIDVEKFCSRVYSKWNKNSFYKFKEKFNLPIDFIDERLTTVEAERMLVEQADASRKKRKKVIDKLAASLILQNYLDAKGKLLKELN